MKYLISLLVIYNYIKNPNEKTLKLEQVGHDECLELFKEYQSKQKEIY